MEKSSKKDGKSVPTYLSFYYFCRRKANKSGNFGANIGQRSFLKKKTLPSGKERKFPENAH